VVRYTQRGEVVPVVGTTLGAWCDVVNLFGWSDAPGVLADGIGAQLGISEFPPRFGVGSRAGAALPRWGAGAAVFTGWLTAASADSWR